MPAPELTASLTTWYRAHARDLPWRREQFHRRYGGWGVLVSELMLQQTPVARVIPSLHSWLERWPTPAALAAETPAEAVRQWANLGYPRRALRLHHAAVQICDRHGGAVPADIDDLLALDGVGAYTARAVAVFAYGRRHPVVDTNTRRVLARALDARSQPGAPSPRDLDRMSAILPADEEDAALLNAAAMELGAVICTARSARCDSCPIASACAWRAAGFPDTGDTRRRQPRYEGSDRQARGAVLAVLREATSHEIAQDDVIPDWPDAGQRNRAIGSLIADGLVEAADGALRLPGPRISPAAR